MGYVLKRLALGITLIGLAAAVLLVSDRQHRQNTRPGGSAPAARGKLPRVAIFQFASRQILDESVRGCLDAFAKHNLIPNKTVSIQRFNAESDLPTANTIAKAIVGGGFDLVITFSTPALQTMAGANKEGKVVHVFGTVTDPYLSGVGFDRQRPAARPRYMAGIGTFQPVKEVFRLAKQCYPDLTRVGVVWCTSETCSEACLVLAREVCKELGITLLEAPVQNTTEVLEAARSLVARDAQALWLGGDNIVEMAVGSLIKPAMEARIPVFANAPDHAKIGALLGLGADYYEVGQATGNLAVEILNGRDPATTPVANVVPKKLAVNLVTLAQLREAWKITPEIMRAAAIVIDAQGRHTTDPLPTTAPTSAAMAAPAVLSAPPDAAAGRPGHKWKIHLLHYAESTVIEDFERGLWDEFPKVGLVRGRDYEIKVSNAQGNMANLVAMVDAAKSDRADLILLTSTPTLQAAAQRVKDIPIIFSVVANPMLAGIGPSFAEHAPNITGICTMSDYETMGGVIRECLPRARRLGTLFASGEDSCIYNKDTMAGVLRKANIDLVAMPVTASSDISEAALALAGKDIDAFCQVIGNIIDASFAGITRVVQKTKLPLFGFATSQARNGGAVVAVARDYEQSGRDTARLAARVLRGESPARIPIQLVSKTQLVINLNNAAACGLTIPASLLDRADEVIGRPPALVHGQTR